MMRNFIAFGLTALEIYIIIDEILTLTIDLEANCLFPLERIPFYCSTFSCATSLSLQSIARCYLLFTSQFHLTST
jgi:hypothetical protein